ncbi:MAG TPA: PilZ domain-containing protein [Pseudolabrys sp.]|nr:PilZ domain-containing protein [Pseudolabrys sp.]
MPEDPTSEKRIAPRRRVLKAAFIVISEKAPKLECAVRNLSDTGAALQVSTTFGIPTHFDVIIDGVRHRCRSVWRTDTKIGVTFE